MAHLQPAADAIAAIDSHAYGATVIMPNSTASTASVAAPLPLHVPAVDATHPRRGANMLACGGIARPPNMGIITCLCVASVKPIGGLFVASRTIPKPATPVVRSRVGPIASWGQVSMGAVNTLY